MHYSNNKPILETPLILPLEEGHSLDFFQMIKHWPDLGLLRALDFHASLRLARHSQEKRPAVLLAICVASHVLGQGHTCLPLTVLFHGPFPQISQDQWRAFLAGLGIQSYDQLRSEVSQSSLVQIMSHDHEKKAEIGVLSKPYVLDNEKLYLARYFDYETQVVNYISAAQNKPHVEFDAQWLAKLFPENPQLNEIDWQKIAVANAALQDFAIISGGPGTGKTTTVTKLLLLLVLRAQARGQGLTIELAAPTGKAAARLSQSIIQAKAKLRQDTEFSEAIFDCIPEQTSTLHRLLGSEYGRSGFRHHQKNPLHLDVLLVDEASMVDLPMMAKLLAALPLDAKLILLGDKDQLASVEAGSVLADLTQNIEPVAISLSWAQRLSRLTQTDLSSVTRSHADLSPIRQNLSLLSKSYRFRQESGIGHFAKAVNDGDLNRSFSILTQAKTHYPDLDWQSMEQTGLDIRQLAKGYDKYWQAVKSVLQGSVSIPALFQVFSQYQILCAVRTGEHGVEQLNHDLQELFYQRGRITTNPIHWYSGKAIIITRNDASLGLFNGDIGICLPDSEDKKRLRVWFEMPDGSLKAYLPSRLSENEAVFVMTVHKSQGSEFDHVELVLPPYESPVLTKELLYTGITRAKSSFNLWGEAQIIRKAVTANVVRYSGLVEKLWSEKA